MYKKRLRTLAKAYLYSKKYNPQSDLFCKSIDISSHEDTTVNTIILLHKKSVKIAKILMQTGIKNNNNVIPFGLRSINQNNIGG